MKKIALIVDKPNWAYYNNAMSVKSELSKKYNFDIIPMSFIDNNLMRLFLLVKDYDLVHFFWRRDLYDLNGEDFLWNLKESGITLDAFLYRYVNFDKISTCVFDHLFLEEDNNITKFIFSKVKNYYVSSNKLKKIYNNLDLDNKPACVITDGVNLKYFYPQKIERFENIKKRKIIIGWVGNSNWGGNSSYKGLNTILVPAIETLKKEGYDIEGYYADSTKGFISYEKMVDYYKKIDMLVCSSIEEGTPNPVLEAMACGVPVISTNVGVVPDVFGKEQKSFILKERTVECMVDTIRLLLNNKNKFKELSDENLKSIKKFTTQEIAKKYDKYFSKILNIQKE